MAGWYAALLESGKGTYQHDVILPNVLRLLSIRNGMRIADVACGPGFFAREFARVGARVTGTDIAPELIAVAKEYAKKEKGLALDFFAAPADAMPMVATASIDAATMILAIQNIERVGETFGEIARILTPDGRLLLVLNHPAFRMPKASEWGWDEERMMQYRRLDSYMSESRGMIEMHPGDDPTETTVSFHRPLQVYFKALHKAGFAVTRLEEWISNRQGPRGRKFAASERARKEFPLFLCLEAMKI